MITINLVCVGSITKKYYKEAVADYLARLAFFCKVNIFEIGEVSFKKPTVSEIEIVKQKEGNEIIKHLKGYNVLLDIKGTQLSSVELAKKINNIANTSNIITFIIGGSHGVSEEVKKACNFKWSMSNLTFPHQLARVMLAEQVYRAFTINNNTSYHK